MTDPHLTPDRRELTGCSHAPAHAGVTAVPSSSDTVIAWCAWITSSMSGGSRRGSSPPCLRSRRRRRYRAALTGLSKTCCGIWVKCSGSGARSSAALDPEPVQPAKPPRPEGREALGDFFKAASSALLAALASADPDDAVWTWSEQHTVAFVRRRQAHEALVHRIDAELTAGQRTGMDRLLSADGVDEALRVMYGDLPNWGEFTEHSDRPLSVATTDTGHSWLVTPGRFVGTEPGSGRVWDTLALRTAPAGYTGPPAATVSGAAADLDCLVWNRPPLGPIQRTGEPTIVAAFDAVLAGGIK